MRLLAGQRCLFICVSIYVLAYLKIHLAFLLLSQDGLCINNITDCSRHAFSFSDLQRETTITMIEKQREDVMVYVPRGRKNDRKPQRCPSGLYPPIQKA